jgi:hypothetical protein
MADLSPFPLIWRADPGALFPATKYQHQRCQEHFKDGGRYFLDEHKERSGAWHRAYFAQVNEAHANLPEGMDADFPTPDHLRKFALIKCGFHHKVAKSFSSAEDALKASAFAHVDDDFCIVTVEGCMVTRYTAKSQDYRHMDKAEFRKSAEAVLAYVWNLVGVDPETGNANAGQAA